MDDHFQNISTSTKRNRTKYTVLAAFVLGTACVMYNGFQPKQEVISLVNLDSDIELALLADPELMNEVHEGLNLFGRLNLKVDRAKVLRIVGKAWDRLDKGRGGTISKGRARDCL